jgi:hypothetical protein
MGQLHFPESLQACVMGRTQFVHGKKLGVPLKKGHPNDDLEVVGTGLSRSVLAIINQLLHNTWVGKGGDIA